jgi:hypothetical protein
VSGKERKRKEEEEGREINAVQKAAGQNSVIKLMFSTKEINMLLTLAEYRTGKLITRK